WDLRWYAVTGFELGAGAAPGGPCWCGLLWLFCCTWLWCSRSATLRRQLERRLAGCLPSFTYWPASVWHCGRRLVPGTIAWRGPIWFPNRDTPVCAIFRCQWAVPAARGSAFPTWNPRRESARPRPALCRILSTRREDRPPPDGSLVRSSGSGRRGRRAPPRSAPPFLECSSSLSQTAPPSTSLLPHGSRAPLLSEELSCDVPCWRSS